MGEVHNQVDNRMIAIKNVGICNYKLSTFFCNYTKFPTIAEFKVGISVKPEIKGAHLSRIVGVLDDSFANKTFEISSLDSILRKMKEELESDNASLEVSFDVIVESKTPITERKSYMFSNVKLIANINKERISKSIGLSLSGSMLCPNSKKISDYGAHSQKCNMQLNISGEIDTLNIDKVIEIASKQFSCEVYSTVKSADEKYMTEKAYDNPKFSEDLIRDTLLSLKDECRGCLINVKIENLESIHQHNVCAEGELQC